MNTDIQAIEMQNSDGMQVAYLVYHYHCLSTVLYHGSVIASYYLFILFKSIFLLWLLHNYMVGDLAY